MTKNDIEVVDYYRQNTLYTDWEIHTESGIDYDEIVKHKTENTLVDEIKNGNHKSKEWKRI